MIESTHSSPLPFPPRTHTLSLFFSLSLNLSRKIEFVFCAQYIPVIISLGFFVGGAESDSSHPAHARTRLYQKSEEKKRISVAPL